MVKDMRLETKRLTIRPYAKEDLMECFDLMQDKELFNYLDMDIMSLDEYKNLFHWLIDSYNTEFDGDFKYSFNIILKETGKHIGWVGIGGLETDHSMKEIFWLIGKNHWNKGYATEAATALLEYGFNVIGLKEIVALCKPENIASKKVMEHIGLEYRFTMEGSSNDFYNGEPFYSLTKDEYQRKQYLRSPSQHTVN